MHQMKVIVFFAGKEKLAGGYDTCQFKESNPFLGSLDPCG
jgi:hypothetical protein